MAKFVFRMHVLAAGHGDCLWVDFGNPDSPNRILVDAGTTGTFPRVKAALDKVRSTTQSHELLIVTHVDADHIGGCLGLVEDRVLAGQFKEFWFNGKSHLLEAAKLQSFGAVQGERLTKALKRIPERWNTAFSGSAVMMPKKGIPPSRTIGEAVVTILSPRPQELAELLPDWNQEVAIAGLKNTVAAQNPKIVRSGWQAFGGMEVGKLADQVVATDTAPANGSSIATLIEYKRLRLLLGADAHPEVLLDGIRRISPRRPLKVDVWKLPHHGSAANITPELLKAVNPKTVVFSSNGAYFRHPDKVTVARIVRQYKKRGVHLVFNYKTIHNVMWDSRYLKKKWNYTADYGVREEGISIHLI